MEDYILIIDDDTRNIFALSLVLKTKGYYCLSATDAREGLAMLQNNNRIRLVLLDMMMPEMDGYQMLRIIKADQQLNKFPIVAVTAQAMPGDQEKCLEAGADYYISKPIDVDDLLRVLKKYAVK